MLHQETVEPRTLELLKQLQAEPLLQSFNLVGGTALALRIGHRKSIDLDLFTTEDFDLEELKSMLVQRYGLKVSYERNQTLKGFIDGVMIDCIRFNYPHIQSPDIIDGIRLESVPTLSTQYSLEEMLDFYISKFPMANVMMPIKALTYFDEIDFNESVVMTTGNFNWNKIAKRLNDMVHSSTKIFAVQP